MKNISSMLLPFSIAPTLVRAQTAAGMRRLLSSGIPQKITLTAIDNPTEDGTEGGGETVMYSPSGK
jgi:hypothetical protein